MYRLGLVAVVAVLVDRSCKRISVSNGSSGIRMNIGSSSSGRMPRKASIWGRIEEFSGLNAIEEVK
jgi:hypothetical protein